MQSRDAALSQPADAGARLERSPQRRSRRFARRLLLALQPVMRRTGLSVRAWRAWEGVLTTASRRRDQQLSDDGLDLPPAALRVRVIMVADPEVFLSTGRDEAAIIADTCDAHGLAIEDAGRLLDFGCGCGRVLRHWHRHCTVEIHGTDHDADLVEWLRAGLPFVHPNRNQIAPPLPYPDNHFGVVYAISVFTHMTDELSRAWISELDRIIRPGGLLLASALDERQIDRLRPAERAAFDAGESIVQFDAALGTNMCVSYHPRAYIEAISPGFDLLSTRVIGAQRLYVLRSNGCGPRLSDEAAFLLDRGLAKLEPLRRPQQLRRIVQAFDGVSALEVGGPSEVFGSRALLPVYGRLAGCDQANYATQTLWDDDPPPSVASGRRLVAEAGDLGVPTAAYGGLLASHVLEHLANPLAALREWQRVVAPGGPLLIVVPHRDRTFDHRRPVTTLAHFVEDDRAQMGEDDLTHLDEIVALHDLRRRPARRRSRDVRAALPRERAPSRDAPPRLRHAVDRRADRALGPDRRSGHGAPPASHHRAGTERGDGAINTRDRMISAMRSRIG